MSFRVPPGVTERTREPGPRSWYLNDDFQQYLLTGFIASSSPVVSLGRAPAPGMMDMTQCVDSVAGREVLVQAWRTRGGTFRNGRRMDRYDVFAVVAVDPQRRFYVASGGYTRQMQDLALAAVRTIVVGAPRTRAPTQSLVIANASIIDPAGGAPVALGSVVVVGDRITAVGPAIPVPPGARVVDARGKYLVPGLWDMHAHLAATNSIGRAPEQYVSYGILGVRDMGGFPDSLFRLRAAIRSGERIGPDLVLAGPTLNGEQSAPFHRKVVTDSEARIAVHELAAAGVDFIKVHRATGRTAFLAILDEARALGLSVCGHVPLVMSWVEASDLGMRTIEHIQTIYENEQPDPRLVAAQFTTIADHLDGPHGDSIFAVLVRNHTFFDPTLIGYEVSIDRAAPAVATLRRAAYARMQALAGRAARDGVRLLAGTDVLERHGDMLLTELERLVAIGLTPRQALAAATTTAAEAMSRGSGRIEPGAPGSFLIVDANPLADIRNLRALSAVVLRGRLIEAGELETLRRADP